MSSLSSSTPVPFRPQLLGGGGSSTIATSAHRPTVALSATSTGTSSSSSSSSSSATATVPTASNNPSSLTNDRIEHWFRRRANPSVYPEDNTRVHPLIVQVMEKVKIGIRRPGSSTMATTGTNPTVASFLMDKVCERQISSLLFSCGDSIDPSPDTVFVLRDILYQYLEGLVHASLDYAAIQDGGHFYNGQTIVSTLRSLGDTTTANRVHQLLHKKRTLDDLLRTDLSIGRKEELRCWNMNTDRPPELLTTGQVTEYRQDVAKRSEFEHNINEGYFDSLSDHHQPQQASMMMMPYGGSSMNMMMGKSSASMAAAYAVDMLNKQGTTGSSAGLGGGPSLSLTGMGGAPNTGLYTSLDTTSTGGSGTLVIPQRDTSMLTSTTTTTSTGKVRKNAITGASVSRNAPNPNNSVNKRFNPVPFDNTPVPRSRVAVGAAPKIDSTNVMLYQFQLQQMQTTIAKYRDKLVETTAAGHIEASRNIEHNINIQIAKMKQYQDAVDQYLMEQSHLAR